MRPKICKGCNNEFTPSRPLQIVCDFNCYQKYKKVKDGTHHTTVKNILREDMLRRKADALYQEAGKLLYPKSILSDRPTEVIHHYIYKSHSNNLRYDLENGIPLLNKEHDLAHGPRQNTVNNTFASKRGQKWVKYIEDNKCVIRKLKVAYLEEVIEKLNKIIKEAHEV